MLGFAAKWIGLTSNAELSWQPVAPNHKFDCLNGWLAAQVKVAFHLANQGCLQDDVNGFKLQGQLL